jgi:nucleoside-triphosphatase THEP1
MSGFKKATKSAAKMRLGLIGPAGSGKTMTALRIAAGLGGRVAVIDTERGSASLYAGERGLDFDVIELDTYGVERFIDAIKAATEGGYSVLVIDSLSHAWAGKGGILEYVDNAGKRNQSGGNFAAWRDATPRHNSLVDAILGAPLHVICTLRSKVEYVVEKVDGRNTVRKVGLQPVQRDGLEYEFTVVGDVTQDHDLVVTKTRAAFLADAVIRQAGEDLGRQLAEWLSDGTTPPDEPLTKTVKVVAPGLTVAHVERFESQEPLPLYAQIVLFIAQAANVRTLGKIGNRLDELVSTDQITADEWSQLTDRLNERHKEIEPVEEVAS